MCFHFLDRLTLASVTTRLGFCVSGKFVRCYVASRHYLNLSAKMEIMKGLLNWYTHMIVTIMGSVHARYVGKPIWGNYVKMCECTCASACISR